MHPDLITIGGFTIHTYGVAMAGALLAAVCVWHILARREGKLPGYASDLGVWLMISGLLGARAAYVIANWETFFAHDLASIIRLDQGGLIYYGGLIGSLIGVSVFNHLKGDPWFRSADLVITPIPLAHALGRIGCFFNGCCYGVEHTGLCSYELNGVFRHPVQLYEASLNIVLFAALFALHKRKRFHGQIFATYLLVYPVVRFIAERFRGDERLAAGPFTTAQMISVLLFMGGIVLWLRCRKTPLTVAQTEAEDVGGDAAPGSTA